VFLFGEGGRKYSARRISSRWGMPDLWFQSAPKFELDYLGWVGQAKPAGGGVV